MSKWADEEEIVTKPVKPAFKDLTLTSLSGSMLYNMLNDEAKIVVLDVRESKRFNKRFIRSSYNVALDTSGKKLLELSGCPLSKIKKKYADENYVDMRSCARWSDDCWMGKIVIVVDINEPTADHPVVRFLLRCHGRLPLIVYSLESGFESFYEMYPFCCTSAKHPTALHSMPWEIVPLELYLGNWKHAEDGHCLDSLNITHVITIHANPESISFPKRKHLQIVNTDSVLEDVTPHFDSAVEFVRQAKKSGGCCLIHCGAGQSRSVTLVVAYLMIEQKKTLEDALSFVRRCHPAALPNAGLMKSLDALDRKLYPDIERRTDRVNDRARLAAETHQEEWRQRREHHQQMWADEDAGAAAEVDEAETAPTKSDASPKKSETKLPPAPAAPAPIEGPFLRVERNFEKIGDIALTKKEMSVGRSVAADIPVEHESCSRQHALFKTDLMTIRDLGSAHGTFVRGRQIEPNKDIPLTPGCPIKFGASSRVYIFYPSPKDVPDRAPSTSSRRSRSPPPRRRSPPPRRSSPPRRRSPPPRRRSRSPPRRSRRRDSSSSSSESSPPSRRDDSKRKTRDDPLTRGDDASPRKRSKED